MTVLSPTTGTAAVRPAPVHTRHAEKLEVFIAESESCADMILLERADEEQARRERKTAERRSGKRAKKPAAPDDDFDIVTDPRFRKESPTRRPHRSTTTAGATTATAAKGRGLPKSRAAVPRFLQVPSKGAQEWVILSPLTEVVA